MKHLTDHEWLFHASDWARSVLKSYEHAAGTVAPANPACGVPEREQEQGPAAPLYLCLYCETLVTRPCHDPRESTVCPELVTVDPLYCEGCGRANPSVKERKPGHPVCDECYAQRDEPEDHGQSFGELYAQRVRGDM